MLNFMHFIILYTESYHSWRFIYPILQNLSEFTVRFHVLHGNLSIEFSQNQAIYLLDDRYLICKIKKKITEGNF